MGGQKWECERRRKELKETWAENNNNKPAVTTHSVMLKDIMTISGDGTATLTLPKHSDGIIDIAKVVKDLQKMGLQILEVK